ncbi:hypothetical protein ACVIIV_004494 [Bradyrhizobium sp. USDA 4354]
MSIVEQSSRAPDAAQRLFGGALQSRGPCSSECRGLLGPGSARQRQERCSASGTRERRSLSLHPPSLRAQRSNPEPFRGCISGLLRCARNDDLATDVRDKVRSRAPTQRSATSAVRCRAGAYAAASSVACWVPALRSNAKGVAARPGRESNAPLLSPLAPQTRFVTRLSYRKTKRLPGAAVGGHAASPPRRLPCAVHWCCCPPD